MDERQQQEVTQTSGGGFVAKGRKGFIGVDDNEQQFRENEERRRQEEETK